MGKCGVYSIACGSNGRKYVGSTRNTTNRWREHRYDLRHNKHDNPHLQNAWNKYGEEDFIWTMLEETERDDTVLRAREKFWIDILKPEFNISEEAWPTRLGAKNSDEHKQKASDSMKERWASKTPEEREAWQRSIASVWSGLSPEEHQGLVDKQHHNKDTPEFRAKMRDIRLAYLGAHPELKKSKKSKKVRPPARGRQPRKPIVHTPEWEAGRAEREAIRVEKIRQSNLGRKRTEEQKQKTREIANAQWADPEYRRKHKIATRLAMEDPSVLQRLSDSHKGRTIPEAQKEKMRQAQQERRKREGFLHRKSKKRKVVL
jgi:group I intron endonuclease